MLTEEGHGGLIFRETTGRLARADSQVASTTYLDWRYMLSWIRVA